MRRKYIPIVMSVLFLLTACQKESDENTRIELITNRKWVLVNYELKDAGGAWRSLFSNWDACDKEDTTVFRSDNVYEVMGGHIKCDPLEPAIIESDVWHFIDNEAKIQFDSYSGPHLIDILNENELVITLAKEVGGGRTEYVRSTYRH